MPVENDLKYSAYWQNHILEDRQKTETRRARLKDSAFRVAQKLGQTYGARKVFLFGSVLDMSAIPEDIDLAVEGIEDALFYKAVFDAQGLSECRVDVVAMEDLPPAFRQRISETGEVLYESH